jgi:hypothetical protein
MVGIGKISMSKTSPPAKPEIIKEQLLTDRRFLDFCNEDYPGGRRLNIKPDFLDAADKVGLIKPLFIEELTQNDEQGNPQKIEGRRYSPFQLFLISSLRNNRVDDEGLLVSRDSFGPEYSRQISWGLDGMTFVLESQLRTGGLHDILGISEDLHNFLKLLHTLPYLNQGRNYDPNRNRLFTLAPPLQFDLERVKTEGRKMLTKHKLNDKKLTLLRHLVGQHATRIDPLEYWYYYVGRHARVRRDVLKGDAAIAQELYALYNLLTSIQEIITGVEPPSLMEFLHEGSPAPRFLMPSITYAKGCDVKALTKGIENLKAWMSQPKNKKYLPTDAAEKLKRVEELLQKYVGYYGDRSYLHMEPVTVEGDDTPLDKLDENAQAQVKAILAQHKGNVHYTEEQLMQFEVARAIESRFEYVQRELNDLIWSGIRANITKQQDKAWQDYKDSQTFVKPEPEQKRLYLKALSYKNVTDELSEATKVVGLVFCKNCRKNPVQYHHTDGDRRVSTEPICDECFAKSASRTLDMTEEDWKKEKLAEWECSFCVNSKTGKRPVLYKFAQRNVISLLSFSKTPIRVQLDYGLVILEAKCPNCGTKQQKAIDWGWGI